MENTVEKHSILIQGAMDIETHLLIDQLQDKKKVKIASWSFWLGTINSYPVVVSRTDMGLVNVTAATTIAIEHFRPKIVINQGTSGGHDPDLSVGDIVIAEQSVYIGGFQTPLTEKGQGSHPLYWTRFEPVNYLRNEDDTEQKNIFYPSDLYLVSEALKLASFYPDRKIVSGIVGSADIWNRELDRIQWFHDHYGTSVEEMESSAVAQITKSYQIPFVGIRVVSNTDVRQQEYQAEVAEDCQKFVAHLCEELIAQI